MSESQVAERDASGRFLRYHEILGAGAYKIVHKGFDTENGVEIAWNKVKTGGFSKSARARLCEEVDILRTINHPNVIALRHSWIDEKSEQLNFITELITSGTLREYVRKTPVVTVNVVRKWAMQILQGLAHLHESDPPIIHRDIKCANIFVNGHTGEIKIGDLGLSTLLRENRAESVIGTPEYMAPEFYAESYNEKVDIWAFAMSVLEMLTGEFPYGEAKNAADVIRRVSSGKLPDVVDRVSDVHLKAFLLRCLRSEADKRPSARELLNDPFLEIDHDDRRVAADLFVPLEAESEPGQPADGKGDDTVPSALGNGAETASAPPTEIHVGESPAHSATVEKETASSPRETRSSPGVLIDVSDDGFAAGIAGGSEPANNENHAAPQPATAEASASLVARSGDVAQDQAREFVASDRIAADSLLQPEGATSSAIDVGTSQDELVTGSPPSTVPESETAGTAEVERGAGLEEQTSFSDASSLPDSSLPSVPAGELEAGSITDVTEPSGSDQSAKDEPVSAAENEESEANVPATSDASAESRGGGTDGAPSESATATDGSGTAESDIEPFTFAHILSYDCNDEEPNVVEFHVRIRTSDGIKEVEFPFNLDVDTPSTVSAEMVESLGIEGGKENVAELESKIGSIVEKIRADQMRAEVFVPSEGDEDFGAGVRVRGWLGRRGQYGWKRRYFVLRKTSLIAYDNEKMDREKGCVNVHEAIVEKIVSNPTLQHSSAWSQYAFRFSIRAAEVHLHLAAATEQILKLWLDALSESCGTSVVDLSDRKRPGASLGQVSSRSAASLESGDGLATTPGMSESATAELAEDDSGASAAAGADLRGISAEEGGTPAMLYAPSDPPSRSDAHLRGPVTTESDPGKVVAAAAARLSQQRDASASDAFGIGTVRTVQGDAVDLGPDQWSPASEEASLVDSVSGMDELELAHSREIQRMQAKLQAELLRVRQEHEARLEALRERHRKEVRFLGEKLGSSDSDQAGIANGSEIDPAHRRRAESAPGPGKDGERQRTGDSAIKSVLSENDMAELIEGLASHVVDRSGGIREDPPHSAGDAQGGFFSRSMSLPHDIEVPPEENPAHGPPEASPSASSMPLSLPRDGILASGQNGLLLDELIVDDFGAHMIAADPPRTVPAAASGADDRSSVVRSDTDFPVESTTERGGYEGKHVISASAGAEVLPLASATTVRASDTPTPAEVGAKLGIPLSQGNVASHYEGDAHLPIANGFEDTTIDSADGGEGIVGDLAPARAGENSE